MRRAEVTLEVAALIARLPESTLTNLARLLARRNGNRRLRRLLRLFVRLPDAEQRATLRVLRRHQPMRMISRALSGVQPQPPAPLQVLSPAEAGD